MFHTNEDLYFIREMDIWKGGDYPKFSYKDFNRNENFKSYIETDTRFQLFVRDKIISEAKFVISSDNLEKICLHFGRISSSNEHTNYKHVGCMTFLVASIIFIILNDEELKQRDIEVSLDIQSDAKILLEKENIDIYYKIFRTSKENHSPNDTYRKYTFKSRNRNIDINYFKNVLISKEQSIIQSITK